MLYRFRVVPAEVQGVRKLVSSWGLRGRLVKPPGKVGEGKLLVEAQVLRLFHFLLKALISGISCWSSLRSFMEFLGSWAELLEFGGSLG